MLSPYREQRWRGPRPWVNPDDRNNSILVSGSKADIQQASDMIEKLDSPSQTAEPRQVRVFAVRSTYPSEFSRRMRELYLDQIKGQTNMGPSDAYFMGDDSGGRMIVAASQTQMPFIEKIMATLDEQAPNSEVQIQIIHLKSANATQISSIIYNAIVSREPRIRGPRPYVTANEQDNSLMVIGNKADIDQAKSMIDQMDAKEAREPRLVVCVCGEGGRSIRVRQAGKRAVYGSDEKPDQQRPHRRHLHGGRIREQADRGRMRSSDDAH